MVRAVQYANEDRTGVFLLLGIFARLSLSGNDFSFLSYLILLRIHQAHRLQDRRTGVGRSGCGRERQEWGRGYDGSGIYRATNRPERQDRV